MTEKNILQTLDDGLIIRTATAEDTETLAEYNGILHIDPGEEFAGHIAHWTRDLLNGQHPTCGPQDFTLVEDTNTGKIISTMCYISQTWAYEGIPFPVGRPEIVSTLDDYRRKGLVRKQFEICHQWGEERGHMLQFITGIPWFYRQFGYEMAVNLGGRRSGTVTAIPKLKDDQKEPFTFRPAEVADIPFMARLYEKNTKRSLLSCVRDRSLWKYEMQTRSREATMALDFHLILSEKGKPVGYLTTEAVFFRGNVQVTAVEIEDGYSWFEVGNSVLRYLQVIGAGRAERESTEEKPVEMTGYNFHLGEDHPLYHVLPGKMPHKFDPYAYYIRIPDQIGFLRLIQPVLEERLAASYMAGHTGELKLNFFKSGIQLTFEKGRIKAIEEWDNPHFETAYGNFPELTFLQLMLGHRDVQQLEDAYPDIYYPKPGAKYLLGALFPRKPSKVIAFA